MLVVSRAATVAKFKVLQDLDLCLLYRGPRLDNLAPTKTGVLGSVSEKEWVISDGETLQFGSPRVSTIYKDTGGLRLEPNAVHILFRKTIARIGEAFHEVFPEGYNKKFYEHPKGIFWSATHPSGKIIFEAEDGIHFLSYSVIGNPAVKRLSVKDWTKADTVKATPTGAICRHGKKFLTLGGKHHERVWSLTENEQWGWDWHPFAIGAARAQSNMLLYHDWKRSQPEMLYEELKDDDMWWTTAVHSHIVIFKPEDSTVLVGRRQKVKGVPTTVPTEAPSLSAVIGGSYEIGSHPIGLYARTWLKNNNEAIYGLCVR